LRLSQDEHHDVRAAAGGVLAALVATGKGGDEAVVALRGCLADPGRKVPATVAEVLAKVEQRTSVATEILQTLAEHQSAYVRRRASGG
jgi:HEAT repeat protein